MASPYRAMHAALRAPMYTWWKRVGVWWLIAYGLITVLVATAHAYRLIEWNLRGSVFDMFPLLIWVIVADAVEREWRAALDGVPGDFSFATRFMLIMAYGWPIALTVVFAGPLWSYFDSAGNSPFEIFPDLIEILWVSTGWLEFYVVASAWLTALIALSGRLYFGYLIISALLFGAIVRDIAITVWPATMEVILDVLYVETEWRHELAWLASLIPLLLLLACVVMANKRVATLAVGGYAFLLCLGCAHSGSPLGIYGVDQEWAINYVLISFWSIPELFYTLRLFELSEGSNTSYQIVNVVLKPTLRLLSLTGYLWLLRCYLHWLERLREQRVERGLICAD